MPAACSTCVSAPHVFASACDKTLLWLPCMHGYTCVALPAHAWMRIVCVCSVCLSVCVYLSATQGLSSELHEFMKSIAICCLDEVALWADSDILETDQAAALCAALRQMRDLAIWDTYTDATHTTVYLEGWALSGALRRDADETLRSLATARYSLHTMEPLHDELLGAILGLGNRVGWVTAAGFYTPDGPAPPAAEYANTPWPWEELKVGMFDVGALLRLPDPGGVPRVVCAKECAFFRSGVSG